MRYLLAHIKDGKAGPTLDGISILGTSINSPSASVAHFIQVLGDTRVAAEAFDQSWDPDAPVTLVNQAAELTALERLTLRWTGKFLQTSVDARRILARPVKGSAIWPIADLAGAIGVPTSVQIGALTDRELRLHQLLQGMIVDVFLRGGGHAVEQTLLEMAESNPLRGPDAKVHGAFVTAASSSMEFLSWRRKRG